MEYTCVVHVFVTTIKGRVKKTQLENMNWR